MLKAYLNKNAIEAGCDEAGRGCLAGPVVAAAVILPKGYSNKKLNDSKKLNEKQRDALRIEIEKDAFCFAVGVCSPTEIDTINILKASFLAMHKALDQLTQTPSHILVDGNRFTPYKDIAHTCVIKGDGKYMSIAAASILAKTYRDAIMYQLAKTFPQYNWMKNKGYPTADHRKAIALHGPTEHHRKSFTLLPPQLKLF